MVESDQINRPSGNAAWYPLTVSFEHVSYKCIIIDRICYCSFLALTSLKKSVGIPFPSKFTTANVLTWWVNWPAKCDDRYRKLCMFSIISISLFPLSWSRYSRITAIESASPFSSIAFLVDHSSIPQMIAFLIFGAPFNSHRSLQVLLSVASIPFYELVWACSHSICIVWWLFLLEISVLPPCVCLAIPKSSFIDVSLSIIDDQLALCAIMLRNGPYGLLSLITTLSPCTWIAESITSL